MKMSTIFAPYVRESKNHRAVFTPLTGPMANASVSFLATSLLMQEAGEVLTRGEFRTLLKGFADVSTESSAVERLMDYTMAKIDNQVKRSRERVKDVIMWVSLVKRPLTGS
jgi:hypothetical protein